jgi:hypothetical protein
MKIKEVSVKRVVPWVTAVFLWIPVSGIRFMFATGGKQPEGWCKHQGPPADWTIDNGNLVNHFGPPTTLRCHWITPTGTKIIEYAWWTNQIFWTLNTLVLTSIPELLLWAV